MCSVLTEWREWEGNGFLPWKWKQLFGGVSYFSYSKTAESGGGLRVLVVSRSKEKPGVFSKSPLCSHEASLVEGFQQRENYTVYWARWGPSFGAQFCWCPLLVQRMQATLWTSLPSTITFTGSPCHVFYQPEISGSEYLHPFLQQLYSGTEMRCEHPELPSFPTERFQSRFQHPDFHWGSGPFSPPHYCLPILGHDKVSHPLHSGKCLDVLQSL